MKKGEIHMKPHKCKDTDLKFLTKSHLNNVHKWKL